MGNMRSEAEMLDLILSVAKAHENIRAVVLNGSRVNEKVAKDDFRDYDVVYFIDRMDSFVSNPNWIDVFGERIIMQQPNEMALYGEEPNEEELVYLMLFTDHNRIDLSLRKVEERDQKQDSLTRVLLDKDQLFPNVPDPTEEDYWVRQPSQEAFRDCCNEFWWVSTYVVKGLLREEIIYAKDIQETIVRKMFLQLIAWKVAADHNFQINLGASHRFLARYLDQKTMQRVKNTYSDFTKQAVWNSLIVMSDTFDEMARELASKLNLSYKIEEATKVNNYIQEMRDRT